jgi:hypothetical protein
MSVGDLDLYGSAFCVDPYGELARLRAQDWYAGTAIGTAVLRYKEVQALLSMRELRTPGVDFLAVQGITDGPLVDIMRGFLLNADGVAHARVRRLVNNAFTARRVGGFRGTAPAGREDPTPASRRTRYVAAADRSGVWPVEPADPIRVRRSRWRLNRPVSAPHRLKVLPAVSGGHSVARGDRGGAVVQRGAQPLRGQGFDVRGELP